MMEIFLMLIARSLPGLDLASLEQMAVHEAHQIIREALTQFWMEQAPEIAADQARDNWDYQRTTTVRPSAPLAYTGDVVFRLWAKLFHHGGRVVDIIRDIYARKVNDLAAPQMSATTDPVHNVRAVAQSQIDVIF